jgi:thiol:disulfide interchange protein DsbC
MERSFPSARLPAFVGLVRKIRMSPRAWILVLGLVSATSAIAVSAADQAAAPAAAVAAPAAKDAAKDAKDPRAALAAKIPGGAKPEEIRQSPIPGMYELTRGTEIAYVSEDGKYAIAGDMYELASDKNLTETTRRAERTRMLASVPESQMVVFSPKDPKYTVSVFTDVDCTYCRKLHSQIAEYNRLGVKVRYLFFPRSGPDTESWARAEAVWCASNRSEALTRAKRGEELVKPKSCANTPVAREYQLGEDVGVRGTPAIVLENGEMLPGYLPPAQLVAHLKGNTKGG